MRQSEKCKISRMCASEKKGRKTQEENDRFQIRFLTLLDLISRAFWLQNAAQNTRRAKHGPKEIPGTGRNRPGSTTDPPGPPWTPPGGGTPPWRRSPGFGSYPPLVPVYIYTRIFARADARARFFLEFRIRSKELAPYEHASGTRRD